MVNTDISIAALPVMESFYTLQGEGYYQGRPLILSALAGAM